MFVIGHQEPQSDSLSVSFHLSLSLSHTITLILTEQMAKTYMRAIGSRKTPLEDLATCERMTVAKLVKKIKKWAKTEQARADKNGHSLYV